MLAFRQALRRWLSERAGPRTALLAQWLQGHVHEPEFRLFGWLQDVEGLALDIGAHRGQSAASVLRLAPGLRVHAFEPNPGMTKALNLLRQLLFRIRPSCCCTIASIKGLKIRQPYWGHKNLKCNYVAYGW